MSSDPVCIDDFEQHAKTFLPKSYWKYYSSGSYANISFEESKNAFKRYRDFNNNEVFSGF
jgi:isopentenyl diphosphate isomerase/L-lactate dehydrogenase-like FMN-dependent dehydrogenase